MRFHSMTYECFKHSGGYHRHSSLHVSVSELGGFTIKIPQAFAMIFDTLHLENFKDWPRKLVQITLKGKDIHDYITGWLFLIFFIFTPTWGRFPI